MKTLTTDNSILTKDRKKSYLTVDIAAASGTLTLDSIVGFAVNKILLIGEIGDEKSEIIKTHASSAPSGSTVTLAANTVYQHPAGTPVYIIDWDQVEISHAATVAGAKTVLATQALQVDQKQTIYDDTVQTAGFYFVRFKETIGNTFSDYSDPIPFAGYADNTVGNAIRYALKRNKMKTFTEFIDHDYLIEEANNGLKDMRARLSRWPSMQSFNYNLGSTARGVYKWALPSTMYQHSNQSVLQVRIRDGESLTYLDKKDWDEMLQDIHHSNLAASALIGATSITLDSVADFDDEGVVLIEGQLIEYTARDVSTGVLSGIPSSGEGSITANLTDDADAWQGATQGMPDSYTIFDGYLYAWPLVDADNASRTILLDFWTEATQVDSDNDTLDTTGYDAIKYWLTAKIRAMKDTDGKMPLDDPDYLQYGIVVAGAIKKEARHGQRFKYGPKLNTIPMSGFRR